MIPGTVTDASANARTRLAMRAEAAAALIVQIVLGTLCLLGIVHIIGWLA